MVLLNDPCDDWSAADLSAHLHNLKIKAEIDAQKARVAYARLMADVATWRMCPQRRAELEEEQRKLRELEKELIQ